MLRYVAFAAVASVANIASQWCTGALYFGRHELYLALAVGTVVGLGTKYLLDRYWVFGVGADSLAGHVGKFGLYSLTGVLTTAIFWAIELAFVALGDAWWLRYAGAAVGLAVGYTVKYRLDRRYVFRAAAT
ncbi:MAG: GtrA family protein [Gammaproteobacteria bacterium]|nr:GtrA family protein [Gammaproteobacteria bacterium]